MIGLELMQQRYLYFAVFASGMTTLAVEFTASRLLGSVFGTSNIVWASIIGLILIYLAVGYFIGGWWADRSPYFKTMYQIMAWGAFFAGLVPLISRPVLSLAADAFDVLQLGILFGSFAAVIVLFTLPVTFLGMISPFAIRLSISDPQRAGHVAGWIYAISTLGSFVGTFLPVLVFIPLVGTTMTFILFGEFLILVALVGLGLSSGWRRAALYAWMPVVLALLALIFIDRPIKSTSGQIFETESAYNYIQVLEKDGFRMLRLNEGQGIHSVWHPTELNYYGPWEQFLVAPFFNSPPYGPEKVEDMAIIGLAAGTLARQATQVYGPIPIDGFEIDPEIIEVGQKYFDMNEPNLNAIAQDGRLGLENSDEKYSVIALDAYRPPYIPWHLTTQEFFREVYDHLEGDGVMVLNVGRSPSENKLLEGLVGTIQSVFPSVYVMDIPDTLNSIIYATRQPTKLDNLYQNYVYLGSRPDVHPLLSQALQRLVVYLRPTPQSETVFTDDLAPIEWITNNMILDYFLFGEQELLR
jgi:predicted membrane-bound spermidine synthase